MTEFVSTNTGVSVLIIIAATVVVYDCGDGFRKCSHSETQR